MKRLPESPRDCLALAFHAWRRDRMTLAVAAQKMGIGSGSLSRRENGISDFNLFEFVRIGCPVGELLVAAEALAAAHGVAWPVPAKP